MHPLPLLYHLFLKLDRAVEQYRCSLAKNHRLQRLNPKRLPKNKPLWDLPMMASSCCLVYSSDNYSSVYSDYSQAVYAKSYDMVPDLKNRLLSCCKEGEEPKIGKKSKFPECHNDIGRCAEPHAARKCLKDHKVKDDVIIDSIIFSIAHVVKTGELRNPCAICRHVFPNTKLRLSKKLK